MSSTSCCGVKKVVIEHESFRYAALGVPQSNKLMLDVLVACKIDAGTCGR